MFKNVLTDFVIFYTSGTTVKMSVSDSLERFPIISALAVTSIITSFILML